MRPLCLTMSAFGSYSKETVLDFTKMPESGLYLITVTLDGPRNIILELSRRLNLLPEVSVKTTFAKGEFSFGGEQEESHGKPGTD